MLYALKRAKTGCDRKEFAIKVVTKKSALPAQSYRSVLLWKFHGYPMDELNAWRILLKPCHCFTSTDGHKGVLGLPAAEVGKLPSFTSLSSRSMGRDCLSVKPPRKGSR